MIHPNERLAILSRIRAVASSKEEFGIIDDLIRPYFGMHHSDDWREMLRLLISKGELSTDGSLEVGNFPVITSHIYRGS